MTVTTSRDVDAAINKAAAKPARKLDMIAALRALAAHINDVAQLPVVTAKLINDALNGVKALEDKCRVLASRIEEVNARNDATHPLNDLADRVAKLEAPSCRGCGKPLLKENQNLADGCPCNSSRGVNHGLVPTDTCICKVCDPNQSGSVRHTRLEMVWTTPESRAELIAKLAPGYEECSEKEADERDGRRAALWRMFQGDWELAWVGERANGAYIWLRSVRRPGIPRSGNAVYATPTGFEVRSFSEAASFGGWTLGYHEEVGEFVLRKTEDGDMPGTGFKWIAPVPRPDAEKLAQAIWVWWNRSEAPIGLHGDDVSRHFVEAVRRALEKCR